MASNERVGLSSGQPLNPHTSNIHPAFSIPLHHGATDADSQDDWEYEYSSTETETYYITADLSIPELARVRAPLSEPPLRKDPKLALRPRWINPDKVGKRGGIRGQYASTTKLGPNTYNRKHFAAGEDNDLEVAEVEQERVGSGKGVAGRNEADEAGDSDQEMMNANPLQSAVSKSRQDEIDSVAETIQILELESANPIMSYRGHTFSCTWAENIGTELLFTARHPTDPLPCLRALDDDIDLLAASSVRLVSREIKLEPKVQKSSKEAKAPTRGKITDLPVRINMSRDASSEKRQQASFLEQLIAIKQRKGEEDEVSIITQKRRNPAEWRLAVKEHKMGELAKLKAAAEAGGSDAEQAQAKIEKLESALRSLTVVVQADDEADEPAVGKKRKRRFFGEYKEDTAKKRAARAREVARGNRDSRKRGRVTGQPRRASVRGRGKSRGRRRGDQSSPSRSPTASTSADTCTQDLSTPTPKRWDELADGEKDSREDEDMY